MTDEPAEEPGGTPTLRLSELERKTLQALRDQGPAPVDEAALLPSTGIPADQLRGTLQRLRSKHLTVVEEQHATLRHLTPRGEAALRDGLPERRLLEGLLRQGGSVPRATLGDEGLSEEEHSAAIGYLRRRGLLAPGMPLRLVAGTALDSTPFPEEDVLREVAAGAPSPDEPILAVLERRGLVRTEHRSTRRWAASEEGRRVPLATSDDALVGALTGSLLASGAWRNREFRPYDVRATVPYVSGARPHPYAAWLAEFEELLIGLGFEQAEGPLLETEFWNDDVLFMPQDHPARSIHDALGVESVEGHPPPADLLARVAAVHEGRPLPGTPHSLGPGWGDAYDARIAARPVLRSQTTAVSARFLARRPKPPFRMFCLDRNFRRESLDARHHIEFAQCEGIVGGEGVDLRHLIGMFQELAAGIGIRELRFRPSYFPFTEPSVEGYVRHPSLGWMETFPGGMFRPEVLGPLEVDVPVAAWGIGITRLAMVALGANDIRDLYSDDLGRLRQGSV